MQALFRANALDDKVRAILVESLYSQPASLAIGALCGIVTSAAVAALTHEPLIRTAATILTIIALVRVSIGIALKKTNERNARTLETLFELGAFSYAFANGIVAALAIALQIPGELQLIAVSGALAYGVGIAARNAGRPVIALGQLVLSLVPIIVALIDHGTQASYILAGCIAMVLPAMCSITLKVFRVLRDSISSAETSARLAEKMQLIARSDVVTGLLNRAGLNHHLVERISSLAPTDTMALIWLDLDKFKEVNDTLGHQIGDIILAEVAARLRKIAPANATVARFGGDEFILACEVEDRHQTDLLAFQIMNEVTRPMRIDNHRLEVGTSMGIALLPQDGNNLESVMRGADLALYQSKVNGRKQITFFEPSMTRALIRRREIESELRSAIQRDELSIYFQPVIDLESGKIRSFEALVRWFHPDKGELSPEEFIAVAEETGLIVTLGNWITAQAAKAAVHWPEDITIAVNLSPLQIRAPGAALGILNALREARLPASRLELEITETVLMDHSHNTENFIRELCEAGVRFALDDFGTGYSSLSYLDKYPFSKIKVDRSFIASIDHGKTSDAIIRAVSGIGATLGMEIVAEGLETAEQVMAVREAGCALGQGYFFSRAVPDHVAAQLLYDEKQGLTDQRWAN